MITSSVAISFILWVALGLILLLLELLLHFLILSSKFFNGGRKSLDLLSQGCRILVGLHLKIETAILNMNTKMFPTDDAKLMKRKFVSQRRQMESIFSPDDCVLKMVTGVVPATRFLMPKSILRSSLRKNNAV